MKKKIKKYGKRINLIYYKKMSMLSIFTTVLKIESGLCAGPFVTCPSFANKLP